MTILSDTARLLVAAESCKLPLDQATTLPPVLFTDPDWFEAERGRVFHSGWVAVARSSEVAEPNQFVTATIADEPCVVVRAKDGQLRALSNVCRHRSTTIMHEQRGSSPSLQCPYHLWTYSHDGQLRAAPLMDEADGFDKAAMCLPQFAVEEWHGWVLVNVDSNATSLSEAAPGLGSLFTEHRIAEVVSVGSIEYPSPWNWKIIVDNFLESYHHRGIHPETLDVTFPGAKSFIPSTGEEPWAILDHVSVVEESEPFIALAAYPSLLIAISRNFGMYWFRVEPIAVDQSHLTIEVFVVPELADEPGIGEAILASVGAINDEDALINQRTADGMKSKFASAGRLSHLEAATWHFHRWLLAQMGE